jgi:hypothetical protein
MKYYRYLQDCYKNATDVLRMYYRSADYRSLHVTTVTTVTTGSVGTSHGLLMQSRSHNHFWQWSGSYSESRWHSYLNWKKC